MSPKRRVDTDKIAHEFSSELTFFQPQSTSLQTEKTTSPQNPLPTSVPFVKYTTHLRPSTIKWIRRWAANHDLKDYEVAQAAFDLYIRTIEQGE